MKKLTVLGALLFCGLLMFAGCAKSNESANNDDAKKNTTNKIAFDLNQTVEDKGFCQMDQLYAEVLDDAAKADGWYYYYTDTDTSPAARQSWTLTEKYYTTIEVLFNAKNISDKPIKFQEMIKARMSYKENEDTNTEYFEGSVFQQNPNQTDTDGQPIMSTKPVEIEAGQSTIVSFRFNITKDIYDKIYATANGTNTGIKETVEFSLGHDTLFEIDLSKTLILSSKTQ